MYNSRTKGINRMKLCENDLDSLSKNPKMREKRTNLQDCSGTLHYASFTGQMIRNIQIQIFINWGVKSVVFAGVTWELVCGWVSLELHVDEWQVLLVSPPVVPSL